MRFRLLIEYDGTRYAGWQLQNGQTTIQGEIEKALNTIFRNPVRVTGAGRTDSGVHARGQVAHFDSPAIADTGKLTRSLNGILDRDIRILKIEPADDTFHARFSARKREYRYYLSKFPQALFRKYCWHVQFDLDLTRMNEAASLIVGLHDFKSFCRVTSDITNYTCTIEESVWYKEDRMIVFRVQADRFLHGMVRTLVGTLTDIGRSKLKSGDILKILDARDRSMASQSAPAKGLILENIYY
jgi:tRNA pseudouridine38-40 synthase